MIRIKLAGPHSSQPAVTSEYEGTMNDEMSVSALTIPPLSKDISDSDTLRCVSFTVVSTLKLFYITSWDGMGYLFTNRPARAKRIYNIKINTEILLDVHNMNSHQVSVIYNKFYHN